MFFEDMQPVDYLSYILVAALTIGGLIAIVVSLVRNAEKKKIEQDRYDSTGVYIPAELAKLDKSKYIVVKNPRYMTLLGKSVGSHIVFSVFGIFIVEYSIESGRIGGRFGNSHWHKATAMGMGSRGFTSPMWRALVHQHALTHAVPATNEVPIFPMAVMPNGTRIDIHLNPYRLDDEFEDDDDWDDYDEELEGDAAEAEGSEGLEAPEVSAVEQDGDTSFVDSDDCLDEEDEDTEDLDVAYDPTKFVGCIEDICEFIADNSQEEVMSLAEAEALAKQCQEYFASVKEMENPDVVKGQIPVEYLGFSRDYGNKKHLKQLADEGVILMGNRKDLAENQEKYQAEAAKKLAASQAAKQDKDNS